MARGFVDHCAQPSARSRIRQVESSALHTAILLPEQSDKVVTQTVLERKLAGHLPTILKVSSERVIAQPRVRDCGNGQAVGCTQQEAGIRKSRGAIQAPAVFPRNASLLRRKTDTTICTGVVQLRKTFDDQFATHLVTMISRYPRETGVSCGLEILQILDAETGPQID